MPADKVCDFGLSEPGLWIDFVELGGGDEGVDGCGAAAALVGLRFNIFNTPYLRRSTGASDEPSSERCAFVPMAKRTVGRRISLQTRGMLASSTRPSRLMGDPLTMWLHRAVRRCTADSFDRRV
jgi:hypothetical protein